ncbi:MAG: sigma-70 family RNA polymerase sigma factor [Candidatus Korobacteraceae bacterium]
MRGDIERALETYRQRSPDSLEKALALLQDTVFAFSMKACGHPEDAEDTMQDVLIKAVRHLDGFDNSKALTVWLYKVARNSCLAHRRRPQSAPFLDLSLDALMPDVQELALLTLPKSTNPEQQAVSSETRELLEQAVKELPPGYRSVLVLHDMEGLNHSEVAQITGLCEGTVRVRLHRARLHVRRKLAPHLSGGSVPAVTSPPVGVHRKTKQCRELFARLSDYIDGVLENDFCRQMHKHLSECGPCLAFLSSLEEVVNICRAYEPSRQPEQTERLRLQLSREYQAATDALARQGCP